MHLYPTIAAFASVLCTSGTVDLTKLRGLTLTNWAIPACPSFIAIVHKGNTGEKSFDFMFAAVYHCMLKCLLYLYLDLYKT